MLNRFSVALVEPAYAINAGYAARLAANFGVSGLYFVRPSFDVEEAARFAMKGAAYLRKAHTVSSLAEIVDSFDLTMGTTAIQARRPWNIRRACITPREMVGRLKSSGGQLLLVMGRETTGLTNQELKLCDIVLSIRTNTDYPTLNMSHALAIVLYEFSEASTRGQAKPAPRHLKTTALTYARELALSSRLSSHKVPLVEDALKHIIAKAQPSQRELSLLVGLERKALLALKAGESGT